MLKHDTMAEIAGYKQAPLSSALAAKAYAKLGVMNPVPCSRCHHERLGSTRVGAVPYRGPWERPSFEPKAVMEPSGICKARWCELCDKMRRVGLILGKGSRPSGYSIHFCRSRERRSIEEGDGGKGAQACVFWSLSHNEAGDPANHLDISWHDRQNLVGHGTDTIFSRRLPRPSIEGRRRRTESRDRHPRQAAAAGRTK